MLNFAMELYPGASHKLTGNATPLLILKRIVQTEWMIPFIIIKYLNVKGQIHCEPKRKLFIC